MVNKNIQFLRHYFEQGPKVDCEGCYACCTITKFTKQELESMLRLLAKKGYKEAPMGKGVEFCEYLDTEGKCVVYEERPIACRVYGIMDTEDSYCDTNDNLDKSIVPEPKQYEYYLENNKMLFNTTVKRLLENLEKKLK